MALTIHKTEMVRISDLNPVGYNPRKITPEKFQALKDNILHEGFLEPIVVQKKGLKIIGGHQRYKAVKEIAIELCITPPDLPCIVLDVDDKRAKKLNIKMNALKGEFEARMLGELLIDIYEEPAISSEEAISLGFDDDSDALKYMHLVEPPITQTSDEDEPSGFAKSVTLSLEFDSVATRNHVKKVMAERSKVEKKKSGDIVAALLAPRTKAKPVKKKSRSKAA